MAAAAVLLQGCGGGGGDDGPSYPSSIDCDGDAGDCHADLVCMTDGEVDFMQYSIHNCPSGRRILLDTTATCEEFAADIARMDSCKKALVCCEANNRTEDNMYCIREVECAPTMAPTPAPGPTM